MKRKLPTNELREATHYFIAIIKPWCIENNYTLHQAFEISRENDDEKYQALSKLWSTPFGKEYLKSAFRGGRIKKEK